MSTYIPTAIDEKAYEQAKKDALGAYSPQPKILISGFLAGFLATWLPGIIGSPFYYFYVRMSRVPRWEDAAARAVLTKEYFVNGITNYARVALWLGLLLGLYGVIQALLRQRSCKANKYTTMEFARYGEVRLSLDTKITIIALPIIAIVVLSVFQMAQLLVWAIFLLAMSGIVYNGLWTLLFNIIIRVLVRPKFEDLAAMGLRVLIPRHVGWNQVALESVFVNKDEKSVRVEGRFDSEIIEKETREVVGHFLRGYHPIYIVNTAKKEE